MAVTVLKHLKESQANPAEHLKNCIKYIMNPLKTENGLWIGGNVGRNAVDVYQAMLETKKDWKKLYGRQGYHFVISFYPGEIHEETAYEIGKEFCACYLGAQFDYVFAVHNDHAHYHVHIVFNSVNRTDGHKYRYVEGDWEKYIQPITDDICRQYGLSELVYDRTDKQGKSYAEHMANREGRVDQSMVIRADIDYVVQIVENFNEFCRRLESMGYQIRSGHSAKYGEYISYHAPGYKNARRDYHLGTGYRIQDVRQRIQTKEVAVDEPVFPNWRLPVAPNPSQLQACSIERVYQAIHYREYDSLMIDQSRVRRDILRIDKLLEECQYLMSQKLTTVSEVEQELLAIKQQIRMLWRVKQTGQWEKQNWSHEEREVREVYAKVKVQMEAGKESLPDKEFERLQEMLLHYQEMYPKILLDSRPAEYQIKIEQLRYQKSILARILRDAEETLRVVPIRFPQRVRQHKNLYPKK